MAPAGHLEMEVANAGLREKRAIRCHHGPLVACVTIGAGAWYRGSGTTREPGIRNLRWPHSNIPASRIRSRLSMVKRPRRRSRRALD